VQPSPALRSRWQRRRAGAGTAAVSGVVGGAYQDAQKEVYFKPFMEKSGMKMVDESWDGGIGVLRAKMQSGANNWDVVQVESEELLLGCEEGLFESSTGPSSAGATSTEECRERLRRRLHRLQLRAGL